MVIMRSVFLSLTMIVALVAQTRAADAPHYEEHILPILREHCAQCHRADKTSAGLDITSLASLEKGGDSGPAVKPGVPENSPLYRAIAHIGSESPMPPDSPKIAEEKIKLLAAWIEGGLKLRSGDAGRSMKPLINIAVDASAAADEPAEPIAMVESLPGAAPTKSGRELPVMAMAVNPWAPLLAVGGNGEVILHNLDTGSRIGAIPFPEGELRVVRFSRSGNLLLLAGGRPTATGKAILVDVATAKLIATIGDDFDVVLAADISADQSLIALGGPEKLVRVYRVADGSLAYTLKKHNDFVTALRFSPNGKWLASGDRASGLFVVDAATGENPRLLDGVADGVGDLDWRRDSEALAVAAGDGSVLLFQPSAGIIAAKWKAHQNGATAISFARDGRLVSGGHDAAARVWSPDGKLLVEVTNLLGSAFRVDFSPDCTTALAGDWSGTAHQFSTTDSKGVRQFTHR